MGDSFSFHQPQVFFYHNELHKFFIICLTRHNILYLPIYIVRILDKLQKEMGDSFSFHQPQVFFYYNELHKFFIISLTRHTDFYLPKLYSAYTYIDTPQTEMGDSFSFHQPQVFFLL